MALGPVVISYLRFSRPEQLKGDSIRRQLAMSDEWAAAHGMTVFQDFRDLGVSAYRGKHATQGALSRLLKLIDDGQIAPGSVLLVEQLDRLSRAGVMDALSQFMAIINRGVRIVTLMDKMEYSRESLSGNMMPLMYSVTQMSLAHDESAKKAQRLAHAWKSKRARIADRPLTRQLPSWCRLEGGKIVAVPEKVRVVQKMFRLVLDGHGLSSITKKMNAEIEGLGRVKYVPRSYVSKILHSRAVLGEFQPHRITYEQGRRRRLPEGDVVQNYFPAIIDADTFYAVQNRMKSRRSAGGPNSQFVNLLMGILYAADGSRMVVNNKGFGRKYVSSAAMDGRKGAGQYISFPADVMERAMLLQLHDHILPQLMGAKNDDKQMQADALAARMDELDRRIEEVQNAMVAGGNSNMASAVAVLNKFDAAKATLKQQLERVKGEIAAEAKTDLEHYSQQLARVVQYHETGKTDLSRDERVELQNIFRATISRIDAKVTRLIRRDYAADCKITLVDGETMHARFAARFVDRMARDAKGHPIKSKATGTLPEFRVEILHDADEGWTATPAEDNAEKIVLEGPGHAYYSAKLNSPT